MPHINDKQRRFASHDPEAYQDNFMMQQSVDKYARPPMFDHNRNDYIDNELHKSFTDRDHTSVSPSPLNVEDL